MNHIVALSGGKDSTAMALLLKELCSNWDFDYVCTPTGRELPEMMAHWARLGELLGKSLTPVPAKNSFAGLVYAQRALPNWRMRWCTRLLKIAPFEEYVLAHRPCTVYVGIRADEANDREGVAWGKIAGVESRYPLVEMGYGLSRVLAILKKYEVTIPARTDCDMCFFQTLWEWFVFWRDYPDRYAQIVAWEDFTGHTLRSAQRDSWPASLRELAARFAAGDIPKRRPIASSDRRLMCGTCAR